MYTAREQSMMPNTTVNKSTELEGQLHQLRATFLGEKAFDTKRFA